MLRIRAKAIRDLEGLRFALQKAVELEHATIPAYLTALYSIKDGTNIEIAGLIQSIVMEEMLHMSLAGNILNAIGGHPSINNPHFIPEYPGPLPMGIGDENGKVLIVPLKKLSIALVKDVFMAIEEPEDPIDFKALMAAPEPEEYHTIGEFYMAIRKWIIKLGDGIFTGSPELQVTGWFPELIAVSNVATATTAIDTIIRQGEGTRTSPFDSEDELAHYYKYAEIFHGRKLVKDPAAEQGYSYAGDPIPFDANGVYNMVNNPKTGEMPADSLALRLSRQFNYSYTSLLNALHITFNGDRRHLNAAIGLMFSLKIQAQTLMQTPVFSGETLMAGPSFEYQPTA